ncbi:MAG: hypothetical protein IPH35_06175 [Rhodoferax sp.]|nr:hypothetical protein [Rhodoferax sp.]
MLHLMQSFMQSFMQRCLGRWMQIVLLLALCVLLGACGGGTSNRDMHDAEVATAAAEAAKVPVKLYTTAPSALAFPSGASAVNYTIGGGVAPYAAGSSNSAVATVTVSKSSLNIAVGAVGSADVWVLDSVGTRVELTVTVGFTTPSDKLRSTAPDKLTLAVGGSGTYTISGGTAPYRTSSSNTAIVQPAVNGSTLLLVSGVASGTAQVLVIDATGTQLVLEVSVGSSTTPVLFTSAPNTLNMATASAARFNIGGGVPPYAVSSSDASIVAASTSGNSLGLASMVAGKATILVLDSVGSSVRFEVTVGGALRSNAPDKITLSAGSAGIYTLSGGVPPYVASSGAPGIVTASVNGTTLLLTGGVNAGADVPVLVTDAAGTQLPALLVTVTASTTTTPSSTLRISAPDKITLGTGSAGVYTIFGGTPPYIASSGAPGIVTASVNGGTLTLVGGPGVGADVPVLVTDAAGEQLPALLVTVTASTTTTTGSTLQISAPEKITLSTGVSGVYTIFGGKPPYIASSGAPGVVTASVNGSALMLVGGVNAGVDVPVVVSDSAGAKLPALLVTVTASTTQAPALRTTAPEKITLGTGSTGVYNVFGGTPPYIASSGAPGIVTAALNGNTLTLTGGTSAGVDVPVLVTDAAGAQLPALLVTVTASTTTTTPTLRTSAPDKITLNSGSTGVYTIFGGTPPYIASSGAPGIVTTLVNGATLTLIGGTVTGDAQVLISDATGTQVPAITVTVNAATAKALYTSIPSKGVTFTSSGASASYSIGGGVPPYAVSSSNASVASASISGTSLMITSGGNGDSRILVLDAVGSFLEYDVTVSSTTPSSPVLRTTAPDSVTLGVGSTGTYTIAGGTPPYLASSGANAVVTAAVNGTLLTLTAGSSTGSDVEVLVIDATGAKVLIKVTVTAGATASLLTSAPGDITIVSGATPVAYSVFGGTLPYFVTSSNTSVATASITGNALSINGLSVGDATIEVMDSGASPRISIKVHVSSRTGAALTVLPSGASGNVGDTLTFTLLGGSPSYSQSVSNTSIARLSTTNVAVNGGTFTVLLLNVGTATVTVRDSLGQTQSFDITVGSVSNQLRLSPSAFIVGENEVGGIDLKIFGGSGIYTMAFSSDLVKATPVAITGNTLTTSVGSSGNRCINPVTEDTPPVYITSGTYDVTFTVVDSLGASATSVMTIKDNGAGLNQGCP